MHREHVVAADLQLGQEPEKLLEVERCGFLQHSCVPRRDHLIEIFLTQCQLDEISYLWLLDKLTHDVLHEEIGVMGQLVLLWATVVHYVFVIVRLLLHKRLQY